MQKKKTNRLFPNWVVVFLPNPCASMRRAKKYLSAQDKSKRSKTGFPPSKVPTPRPCGATVHSIRQLDNVFFPAAFGKKRGFWRSFTFGIWSEARAI